MARRGMIDRRIRNDGPPQGCPERRQLQDRRKAESPVLSEDFETLMSARGFRRRPETSKKF